MNECHTKDACGKHTTCKNTAGSYSCPCHIGFAQAKGATLSDDCQGKNTGGPACELVVGGLGSDSRTSYGDIYDFPDIVEFEYKVHK